MTKTILRRELYKRLQNCDKPPEQELRATLDKLKEQLAYHCPDLLLAFVPRHDEVDVWPVLQAFSSLKACRVAFAKVVARNLEFALWQEAAPLPDWSSLCEDEALWRRHPRWDLVEPNFPSRIIPKGGKLVLLCPGLGFCIHEGQIFRLGRGKGFYDRAIARLRSNCNIEAWGVGYGMQWHPDLPLVHEPERDQVLDRLFIAGQLYRGR
ncbi:MAG: 5-formyltetrahydrofolate cyclo-ligase [Spirochaetota bacterium]